MSAAGAGREWDLDPTASRVVAEIVRRGPVSRADLARALDLSTASLTRVTKPLVAAGLVREHAATPGSSSAGGRPSRPLGVVPGSGHAIGVNLGDRRLQAVLVNVAGAVVGSEALLGLSWESPERIVGVIAGIAERWKHAPGMLGIGVSLGASVEDHRVSRASRFPGWPPMPLADMVENATGLATVVANDLDAYTLAEHWFGLGRGTRDFALVTMGSGVGGGVVANDELVEGHAGAAGLVGDLPTGDGRRFRDVLETGQVLRRAAQRLGRPVDAAQLRDLAGREPRLDALLDDVALVAGELAGCVALVTAPETVVLSGEGTALLAGREHLVEQGAASFRAPENPWRLVVSPVRFEEWARGAAVMAIRARMGRRQ